MRCTLNDNNNKCKTLKVLLLVLLYFICPQALTHQIGAVQNRLDVIQQNPQQYSVRWRSTDGVLSLSLPADIPFVEKLRSGEVSL